MAFDFLKNIGIGASDIADLGGAAANVVNMSRRPNPMRDIPTLQNAINASEAARTYANAAVNPASAHFKNLQMLEEARVKRDLVAGIEEVMRANRRARATGRVGVNINPERRDESISRAIAEQFAQAGDRASKLASDKLAAAANAESRNASSLSHTYSPFAQYAALGRIREFGFSDAIADTMKKIGSIHDQNEERKKKQQQPIGQGIQWWPQPSLTASPSAYPTLPDMGRSSFDYAKGYGPDIRTSR